jgi:type IV secretion system protein VirB10
MRGVFSLYCGLVCGICRLVARIVSSVAFLFIFVTLASGQDFSGTWKLKSQHVEAGALPEAPAAAIEIEQHDRAIECAAGSARWSFSTDGKEVRARIGRRSLNTVAKWEGSALLVNTIVNDPARNYTQMDRWTISRDHRVLTVSREIAGRDVEATLVYERADAQTAVASAGSADPPKPAEYMIEAGTHVPLLLVNSVSMKHSSEGDRVYLRTAFPILSKGIVVIPPGSNVAGTLTFVKPPGHLKGRGEVFIRFDSLTLPNGVTRDFRARVDQVDASTHGHVDSQEGSIKGEDNKGGTAGTVAKTTAAGASVGGIAGAAAGHAGAGLGVGAAAGAVAGLLLSHGPDTVLAAGSSVEMVLDRPLVYAAGEVPSLGRRGR